MGDEQIIRMRLRTRHNPESRKWEIHAAGENDNDWILIAEVNTSRLATIMVDALHRYYDTCETTAEINTFHQCTIAFPNGFVHSTTALNHYGMGCAP